MLNSDLFKMAETVQLPDVPPYIAGGVKALSFGIVNSAKNGKRFSLSKGLTQSLGLTDTVMLMPLPEKHVLMIAKKLPFSQAQQGTLKGEDGRMLVYRSDLVLWLTQRFDLNFGKHVSMSFQNITLDTLPDGSPVAIVKVVNPYPEEVVTNEALS